MRISAYHVARVGTAITYLWIGVLILKDPSLWFGYVRPWAQSLLPVSLLTTLTLVAIFDIIIGFLFLIQRWIWPASALAALHLIVVLIVAGINEITVRDIGILATTLALFINTVPPRWFNWFKK